MDDLNELKCEACVADAPRIEGEEAKAMLEMIPAWEIVERDGIPQLERVFKFRTFKQAWAFSDKVATLAEDEGHHPAILLEWGKVTVSWWSHKIKGLHKNDFICAAKTDSLCD
ncbi:4a-hydroxytetrahydrobiopterin dehydratase [Veronia pacifica]|uniref:Putative pterin-4-alpha-carbinolamine dehydratase n=1 Tax=Veronia pacifica TaxID=1080227 RepID=A0A1C3EKP4_9GAMM|nr:4a-hydroxytetrahydrobiopterin dehydratase [Veronia pacifica]ODA33800.1 4a-hydroxytetrahydrobiopterin dehydratase [Veronia pacifica]